MFFLRLGMAVTFLIAIFIPPASAQSQELQDYIASKKDLSYREQFNVCLEAIASTTSETVLDAAIGDIEKMSDRLDRNREAQEVLEDLLKRWDMPSSSPLYQHAFLVRARILYRMGGRPAGEELFRIAMRGNYRDAYVFYIDTLDECGEPALAAQTQFNWAIDERAVPSDWRNFIAHFFEKLLKLRVSRPEILVTEQVYPYLAGDEEHPEYKDAAHALCLLADWRYEEAYAELRKLDSELAAKAGELPEYSEYRNIPLYIAAVAILGGEIESQVKPSIEDFISRNEDRPEYVLRMSSKLAQLTALRPEWLPRIPKITGCLIEAGYGDLAKYNNQLTDEYYAAVLWDLHALGLTEQRKYGEAKEIYQSLVDDYFPKNLVGVNAMFNVGHILWKQEGDIEGAKKCFHRIINESNDHHKIRWSKGFLVDIWREEGEPDDGTEAYAADIQDSAKR